MAIERSIYASLMGGIENASSGFQYYSYTEGYKNMLQNIPELVENVKGFYRAPENAWWMKELHTGNESANEKANELAEKAKKLHPLLFAYKKVSIGENERCIFLYGKNIIFDDVERPGNVYEYNVVCEKKDVKNIPISYAWSPVACCDIKRDFFFPGENPRREYKRPTKCLDYTAGIEQKDDNLTLPHTAGFEPVDEKAIIEFLKEGNRIEILLKMFAALIKLKEGNVSARIVIADENRNIIKWIAAISFLLPDRCLSDVSFTTYSYNVREYDINGVYVPELNGCEEDNLATSYSYESCKNNFAVFDFARESFAEHIDVRDIKFGEMVSTAIKININLLKQYKKFIDDNTTYSAVDSDYFSGYYAYLLVMKKNVSLEAEAFEKGMAFIKKYCNNNICKDLLETMLKDYRRYMEDSSMSNIFSEYIGFCKQKGFVKQKDIDDILLENYFSAFEDMRENGTQYKLEAESVKKVCNYTDVEMSRIFIEKYGVQDELPYLIRKLASNKSREGYIWDCLFNYIANGYGQLKKGNPEYSAGRSIMEIMIDSESTANDDKVKFFVKQNELLKGTQQRAVYLDMLCSAFESRSFSKYANSVMNELCVIYGSLDEVGKKELVNGIFNLGRQDSFTEKLLNNLKSEKAIQEYINVISIYDNHIVPYSSILKENTLQVLKDSYTCSVSDLVSIYGVFEKLGDICGNRYMMGNQALKEFGKKFAHSVVGERRDFILNEKEKHILKNVLNDLFEREGKEYQRDETVQILNAIEFTNYCKENFDKKKVNWKSAFQDAVIPDIRYMPKEIKQQYIENIAKIFSIYWIETGKRPDFSLKFTSGNDPDEARIVLTTFIMRHMLNNSKSEKDVLTYIAECIELLVVEKKECEYKEVSYMGTLKKAIGDIPERIARSDVKSKNIIKLLEDDVDSLEKGKTTEILSKARYAPPMKTLIRAIKEEADKYVSSSPVNEVLDTMKKGIKGTISNLWKKN